LLLIDLFAGVYKDKREFYQFKLEFIIRY